MEWKDETNHDRLKEYFERTAREAKENIAAADPEGDLDCLSEGMDEILGPYVSACMQQAFQEDPDISGEEMSERLDQEVGPIHHQLLIDRLNAVLHADGFFEPNLQFIPASFTDADDIESLNFVSLVYGLGDRGIGLQYQMKDGSIVVIDSAGLEQITDICINRIMKRSNSNEKPK